MLPIPFGDEEPQPELAQVGNSKETAGAKSEEGEINGRSVRPESPGLHARYKGQDNGLQRRKAKAIPKPVRSLD